jgi:hypothetical protein
MNAERAETFNSAGIAYGEAIRSLRSAGYNDAAIDGLVAIVRDDGWGEPIWRWCTDAVPGWENETVAAWHLPDRAEQRGGRAPPGEAVVGSQGPDRR